MQNEEEVSRVDVSATQRATIRDVAKAAGVSLATVSRVLNDIGVVRPVTRQKVLDAVARLNYSPNVRSSAISKARSRPLGLVVPDITNPFFSELGREIWESARAAEMDLLLTNSHFDPDAALDCIEDLVDARVAGIIILTSVFDFKIIDQISQQQIPLCLLDINAVRPYVSTVSISFHNSTIQVIEHLISLGHSNIAYGSIRGPLKMTPERNKVFESCCHKYASLRDRYRIIEGEYSLEGGKSIVERLFDGKAEPPTAIWFTGDIMALGAMRELHRRGLRVPKDVSIIGQGNTFLCQYSNPELTTVSFDSHQIAQLSVAAIRHLQTAQLKEGLEYTVNSRLVLRASTGPARSDSR